MGVAGKEGGDFFQVEGGVQFSHKNKLKSEIFNNEKKLEAKVFFCHSNWEILSKILVTFKR